MPLVIRELVIRARLDERSGGSSGSQAQDSQQAAQTVDIDEIISLCIEKVMEIIERKEER